MNSFKTFLLLLAITGLFLVCGELIAGRQGMILAFVLSVITNFFSYYFSDKIVLSMYKAKELPRNLNADIYKVVDSLAVSANIPTPKVYYINSSMPNAFATGRITRVHANCSSCTRIIGESMVVTWLVGVVTQSLKRLS